LATTADKDNGFSYRSGIHEVTADPYCFSVSQPKLWLELFVPGKRRTNKNYHNFGNTGAVAETVSAAIPVLPKLLVAAQSVFCFCFLFCF
jgi:hypothetical protein